MRFYNLKVRNSFYEGEVESEHEEEKPPVAPPPSAPPAQEKKPRPKITLTPEVQGYVNSLLAEEKRKAQGTAEQLITQLETQKNLATTSQAEREALETRIESLRSEFTTKEELQRKDNEKKLKEEKAAREKAERESQSWKEKFYEDRIRTAIVGAAVEFKAYDPEQIYAILRPKARLIDALGDDNKPNGEFIARVKMEGKGQDGPTQLDLTVTEAVKVMNEMPEKFGNLFNSGGVGGLGGLPSGNRNRGGLGGEPTDPEAYMEYRKKKGRTSANIG